MSSSVYVGATKPVRTPKGECALPLEINSTAPYACSSIIPDPEEERTPPPRARSRADSIPSVEPEPSSFLYSIWGRLILGQFVSLVISSTSVFSSKLVELNSSLPTLQGITSYGLIFILTGTYYLIYVVRRRYEINAAYRQLPKPAADSSSSGPAPTSEPIDEERPAKWTIRDILGHYTSGYKGVLYLRNFWKYALIALIDVEANYVIVLAYQYSDMTSIQLLDCSTIVFVMLLSWLFLRIRYYVRWHIIGALIAVLGMVGLVLTDADGLSRSGDVRETKDILFGDAMTVLASALYAISNVATERVIREACGEENECTKRVIRMAARRLAQQREDASDMDASNGDSTSAPATPSAAQSERSSVAADLEDEQHLDDTSHAPLTLDMFNPWGRKLLPLHLIVIIEYVAWMSLFALLIGTAQFFIVGEHLLTPLWNEPVQAYRNETLPDGSMVQVPDGIPLYPETVAFHDAANGVGYASIGYNFGFGVAMIVIYIMMPLLFVVASAAFANLSLLTCDLFSVIWNVALFSIYPRPIFALCFIVIMFGVIVFDTNGFQELVEWIKARNERKEQENAQTDEAKGDSIAKEEKASPLPHLSNNLSI